MTGLLVGALWALPVGAQDQGEGGVRTNTPSTQTRGQGNGIALSRDGNARMHLSLDSAVGFDSNPYSIPFDSEQGFAGDGLFRLRPGFELRNPGGVLSFNSNAFFDWGLQMGAIRRDTQDFFLYQGGGAANLELNRGGTFSFGLGDSFSWNRDPGVVAIGAIFNRLNNNLKAGLNFRPGGGTLSFRLLYGFMMEKWFDFTNTASELVRQGSFDQMAHTATLRADWRFFPRTGAFLNLRSGIHSYPFDAQAVNPTSFPVSAQLGMMGQFTPRLSGLIQAGYGNTLVLDTEGIDTGGVAGEQQITNLSLIGVVGQAELRYQLAERIRMAGGFRRNFTPAPLYQFVGNSRFYATYQQLIGSQLQVQFSTGLSLLEFGIEQLRPEDGQTTQPVGRFDTHLDARVQLDYFLTQWFSLGISNDVDWRTTNAADSGDGSNFSFFRNETLVIASLRY
jgi:hypothetical protein